MGASRMNARKKMKRRRHADQRKAMTVEVTSAPSGKAPRPKKPAAR